MRTELALDADAEAENAKERSCANAICDPRIAPMMMNGRSSFTGSNSARVQAYCTGMLDEEIRQFLHKNGIWLDTDKGQHFLTDASVLEDIVTVADIQSSDSIIEIGPGIGILTRELLSRAGSVTAIEIDPRMIPLLRIFTMNEHAELAKNLTIVEGNALQAPMPTEEYKIVANIPYHITSPLLTHALLESPRRPKSLTLLIQREVAENICSEESDSMLTILVRLFGTPSLVRLVPPRCFLPPPKVDSAVLHIECFTEPKTGHEEVQRILKLAKLAFSKRRKMLRNTIGEMPSGADAMIQVGIDAMRRPQTLTIDEWIALDKALTSLRASS